MGAGVQEEETAVRCVLCGGELREQVVDVPFTYKGHLVLIRRLRAYVCEQCGDIYLPPNSDEAVKKVLDKIDANKFVTKQVEVIVEIAT
ncbi:MAG TPA: YgiT-type zinc finger protein [Candidatus Bathyarchaeota archaeon]|nr:YgiT-type zinc finger protein [Candidatus Bathyarchaeota archaeon]